MVILGLRMLGLLKGLPRAARLVPSPLRVTVAKLGSGLRSRGPFAVGVLNGFMPCGPLQTMQLYALGTGSALAGAASMFVFSIGTVPLMLVFGLTAALLPRKFVPVMVKASAVLVMFLGVVTFGRAAALSGIPLPDISSLSLAPGGTAQSAPIIPVVDRASSRGPLAAILANGVQTITTEFKDGYYVPFTVQAGVPLKWTIRVREEDLNGCNNPVEVPGYKIRKILVPGDNLIEFTPAKEGVIPYSCWMGMIKSRITVVKDLAAGTAEKGGAGSLSDRLGPGSGTGGGACCSGSTNPDFALGRVPSETIGMPVVKNGIQEITITVGNGGYTPAAFVLQKGMKAIVKFKAEEVTSCNSPVVFPEYNGALDLAKGQLETPAIPITGDFTFQCWMGMLHGYVKAVDDLSKVDVEKVRDEIRNYRASGGSIGGAGGAGGCCGGAPVAKK
jgi:plastocyanin domain-containing protein